jgi:hypothetical protein
MADKLAKYGTFLSANRRLPPVHLPNDLVLNFFELFYSTVFHDGFPRRFSTTVFHDGFPRRFSTPKRMRRP